MIAFPIHVVHIPWNGRHLGPIGDLNHDVERKPTLHNVVDWNGMKSNPIQSNWTNNRLCRWQSTNFLGLSLNSRTSNTLFSIINFHQPFWSLQCQWSKYNVHIDGSGFKSSFEWCNFYLCSCPESWDTSPTTKCNLFLKRREYTICVLGCG